MAIDYAGLDDGRGVSYWAVDPVLRREVRRTTDPADFEAIRGRLAAFGEAVGTTVADNADVVDDNPPELRPHDRDGCLVNEVDYHPAHRENERIVYGSGVVADAFRAPEGREDPLPLVHNFAAGYLLGTVDVGLGCPMAMTAGAAAVLERFGDDVHEPYLDALTTDDPDAAVQGAMFLTERQGGSDVGRTETTAEHVDGRTYELTGEKWFCSNLDAGCVLTLARRPDAPGGTDGLSLFLVPRAPDADPGADHDPAARNDYRFRRLKDKLGTRSVATGEVELDGTTGYLVGDHENGFKQMAEMLNVERVHNAMASVGVLARARLESVVQAEDRVAFGEPIIDKPLMRRDLVDLAVAHEAAAALTFDAAADLGAHLHGDDATAYRRARLLTPVAKHVTGRLAVDWASYAVEIQGGNGYTDRWVTERLLRDAQVLPVWEGTANVLSLDVLRALASEAAHVPTFERARGYVAGVDDRLADEAVAVEDALADLEAAVDDLATADRDRAEHVAKEFAEYVYDACAAAVLVAEADRDLADGDARKVVVARRFVADALADRPARGITMDAPLSEAAFDAVVRHERLAPADLPDADP
jgi:acyl-CoA dehydrogenase